MRTGGASWLMPFLVLQLYHCTVLLTVAFYFLPYTMRSSHGQATDPTEVGTGLAASPGIPPSPIAGCMAYSGATRFVRYTSDHCHTAVWRSRMSASRVCLLA